MKVKNGYAALEAIAKKLVLDPVSFQLVPRTDPAILRQNRKKPD